MTFSTLHVRLCWSQLGVRVGCTARPLQQAEILDAVERMTWAAIPARPPGVDGDAVGAFVDAVLHHRRGQFHLVGVTQLSCGRQLIGLDDGLATRQYLLDLDSETIYVLAEFTALTHAKGVGSPVRVQPEPDATNKSATAEACSDEQCGGLRGLVSYG